MTTSSRYANVLNLLLTRLQNCFSLNQRSYGHLNENYSCPDKLVTMRMIVCNASSPHFTLLYPMKELGAFNISP